MIKIVQVILAAFLCILTLTQAGAFASSYGEVSQTAATMGTEVVLTSAQTAAGLGSVDMDVSGMGTLILAVSGTHTGLDMVAEGSLDGVNFGSTILAAPGGILEEINDITGNGYYYYNVAGLKKVRVDVTTITTGSVTVKGYTSPIAPSIQPPTDYVHVFPVAAYNQNSAGTLISGAIGNTSGAGIIVNGSVTDPMSGSFMITGLGSATVNFFGSYDNGTTYISLATIDVTTGIVGVSTTTNGLYRFNTQGITHVKASITNYSSGTISVGYNSSSVPLGTDPTVNNLAQVAGAAIATGHGSAAGTIRVELPTDGTGTVGLNAGSNVIGSLTANQSVNLAQVNGAPLSGGNPVLTQLVSGTGYATSALQNAATANSNGTNLGTGGLSTVVLNITGTFVATVNFEASADSGTTWVPISGFNLSTQAVSSTATTTGYWQFNVTGTNLLRARISGYTSGTVNVWGNQSTLPGASFTALAGTPVVAQTASSVPTLLTMQSAAAAIGNGTSATVTGYNTSVISITGTFVATVTFEASIDGSNWVSVLGTQVGTTTTGTTASAPGDWQFNVAGYQAIRARISSYTSGSVTAKGSTTVMSFKPPSTSGGSGYHNDCRVTLTTGTPVTTSDVTGASATTIYVTPYKGDQITLFNTTQSAWITQTFAEASVAVPATTSTMYDVFVSSATNTTVSVTAVAWTNDTTRAQALALLNGRYVESADHSRLYAGSFRTTATSGQTEDSAARRFVWNYYNRISKRLFAQDPTSSWTYATATVRAADANTSDGQGRVSLVIGVSEDPVDLEYIAGEDSNGIRIVTNGIGIDTTTTMTSPPASDGGGTSGGNNFSLMQTIRYCPALTAGLHFCQMLEYCNTTVTFYGTNAVSANNPNSWLTGIIRG